MGDGSSRRLRHIEDGKLPFQSVWNVVFASTRKIHARNVPTDDHFQRVLELVETPHNPAIMISIPTGMAKGYAVGSLQSRVYSY